MKYTWKTTEDMFLYLRKILYDKSYIDNFDQEDYAKLIKLMLKLQRAIRDDYKHGTSILEKYFVDRNVTKVINILAENDMISLPNEQ